MSVLSLEIQSLFGLSFFYLSVLIIMTAASIGSAYIIFWWALFQSIALLVTLLLEQILLLKFEMEVDLWFIRLFLSIVVPSTLTVELFGIIFGSFVPTMGRIGYGGLLGEFRVAAVISFFVGFHLIALLPYKHRFISSSCLLTND